MKISVNFEKDWKDIWEYIIIDKELENLEWQVLQAFFDMAVNVLAKYDRENGIYVNMENHWKIEKIYQEVVNFKK